jgi:hypothetical protein
MKFKKQIFRVDYQTEKKIIFLCNSLNISKSDLFRMGIDQVYNDSIKPSGAEKDVHRSISRALLDIAIYLNSNKAEDGDSNDFFIMAEKFLRDIADDPNLNKSSI